MADEDVRSAAGPADTMRSCIKPACRWPAVATLSYRYVTAEVWLSDLGEPDPATHDLCPHHADSLRVPRGWTLIDDRRPVEAVHEPSAAELVERVTKLRSNVDAALHRVEHDQPVPARQSRYAALLADLPTYTPPTEHDADDGGLSAVPDAAAEADPAGGDGAAPDVVDAFQDPADAGVSADAGGSTIAGDPTDVSEDGADRRDVPVLVSGGPPREDDAVHETGLRGAVVVPLPLRMEGWDDA